MTDEQALRNQLETAVPEPPDYAVGGASARNRWRRSRRRRLGTGAVAVLVVGLSVPAIRSLSSSHQVDVLPGTSVGTGARACAALQRHDGLGYLIDTREVDATTAGLWSSALSGSRGPVTVCVLNHSRPPFASDVVATREGRHPVVVVQGSPTRTSAAMIRLGELQEHEQATLTDAAFGCPSITNDNATLPGSATLPLGATSVRICSDGSRHYPPQALLSGADDLVRAINNQPLAYFRGSTCGGMPGIHGYTLVFDYPHGTRTAVGDGCGWIGVGPVQRKDTYPTVGDRFLMALESQERASGG